MVQSIWSRLEKAGMAGSVGITSLENDMGMKGTSWTLAIDLSVVSKNCLHVPSNCRSSCRLGTKSYKLYFFSAGSFSRVSFFLSKCLFIHFVHSQAFPRHPGCQVLNLA